MKISLGQVSERMALYLNFRCGSLKVLPLFKEIRDCVSSRDFTFMHQTSIMSLDTSEVFLILDRNGRCIMAEPQKYHSALMDKVFKAKSIPLLLNGQFSQLISKAIPLKNPTDKGDTYYVFAFAAMSNPDKSFGGIMGLGFDVEKLFNFYYKPLEYDGSKACVTDENGNIEVFNDHSLVMLHTSRVKPILFPKIPEKIKENGYSEYYLWENQAGVKYLLIYQPIDMGNHKWIAQFKIPYSIIDQALEPFYRKLMLLFVILLLIAILGIFIAISASKQINQLRKQISALEIQIDHEKKNAAVDGIISSDYFKTLREQAKILKK